MIKITGATLRAALEHGVSRVREEKEAGLFPQVSGLRFTYDGRLAPGARVTSVTVNGAPLDPVKNYTLAVNTYLLGGGRRLHYVQRPTLLLKPEEAQVEPAMLMNIISPPRRDCPRLLTGASKETMNDERGMMN